MFCLFPAAKEPVNKKNFGMKINFKKHKENPNES